MSDGGPSDGIFLSYRRRDRADLAERLYDHLEEHLGSGRVFIDIDRIPVGANFVEHIESVLDRCAVLLALIGEHWLAAFRGPTTPAADDDPDPDFVQLELQRAFARGIRVIPVLLGATTMPTAADLPQPLRPLTHLQAARLRSGPDFRRDVNDLLAVLGYGSPGRTAIAPAVSSPPDARHRPPLFLNLRSSDVRHDPKKLVGYRIGSYITRELLGDGGTGVALRASHETLARDVCVKVSYSLGDRSDVLMKAIQRGMRGLVRLDHPNIVKVYDFEELRYVDGYSFFVVQEYIKGPTLGRWSRQVSALPDPKEQLAARLEVGRQIAEGLDAAHHCVYEDDAGFQVTGVLHGDVKPGNVIVKTGRVPVLVDFMLVDVQRHVERLQRSADPADADDRATMEFGTPMFMAPEQEQAGIVTTASDVFALGVTFQQLFGPVGVSRLESLFQRMTAPDPSSRPRLSEVIDELRQ